MTKRHKTSQGSVIGKINIDDLGLAPRPTSTLHYVIERSYHLGFTFTYRLARKIKNEKLLTPPLTDTLVSMAYVVKFVVSLTSLLL